MANNPYLRNAEVLGGTLINPAANTPQQYEQRRRQYFGSETSLFVEKYAKYASDFVKALAQGLNKDDPTLWETVYLRFSDIGRATATTTKLSDDYKRILIANRKADYIRPGTKFVTMGSTWLAINPNNMSGVGAGGIVQRCNAVWNHLDWYGNVVSEPIAVDRYLSRANNTDTQEAMNLTKGYFDVKAQKNKETAQLGENSRMILGRNCYRITGFSDFTQEFTGDYESVRMLEFSIHYEEPNYTIDDMENHVAGGKEFSWNVRIAGRPNMTAGETALFTASSQRKNQTVESSENHPISYLWSSSDETVATVDENGIVTTTGSGVCTITATLAQNPAYSAEMELAVAPVEKYGVVKFLQTVPEKLSLFESVTLEAAYFWNGEKKDYPLTWQFSGADKEDYSVDVNGNTATITCWSGSVKPLMAVVQYESESSGVVPAEDLFPGVGVYPKVYEEDGFAAAEIALEGF